jgi:hypothetical protein
VSRAPSTLVDMLPRVDCSFGVGKSGRLKVAIYGECFWSGSCIEGGNSVGAARECI